MKRSGPDFETDLLFSDGLEKSAPGVDPRLERQLRREARALGGALLTHQEILVLAESCTAGRVSAAVGEVPGISAGLAGSWVTYQKDSKRLWLGLPATLLKKHPDAVSAEVSEKMALQALRRTPRAGVAAAITGHLNPPAFAWLTVLRRDPRKSSSKVPARSRSRRVNSLSRRIDLDAALASLRPSVDRKNERANRQVAASILLLRMVRALITLGVSQKESSGSSLTRVRRRTKTRKTQARRTQTRGKERP